MDQLERAHRLAAEAQQHAIKLLVDAAPTETEKDVLAAVGRQLAREELDRRFDAMVARPLGVSHAR